VHAGILSILIIKKGFINSNSLSYAPRRSVGFKRFVGMRLMGHPEFVKNFDSLLQEFVFNNGVSKISFIREKQNEKCFSYETHEPLHKR
jgi:hypothetical protein